MCAFCFCSDAPFHIRVHVFQLIANTQYKDEEDIESVTDERDFYDAAPNVGDKIAPQQQTISLGGNMATLPQALQNMINEQQSQQQGKLATTPHEINKTFAADDGASTYAAHGTSPTEPQDGDVEEIESEADDAQRAEEREKAIEDRRNRRNKRMALRMANKDVLSQVIAAAENSRDEEAADNVDNDDDEKKVVDLSLQLGSLKSPTIVSLDSGGSGLSSAAGSTASLRDENN